MVITGDDLMVRMCVILEELFAQHSPASDSKKLSHSALLCFSLQALLLEAFQQCCW